MSNKIGIISQARMTSTRLPGKVLINCRGVPLLEYHTTRLQQSNLPVFIATTTNKEDDPIVQFCNDKSIPFFRGSEHDVLKRFLECAQQYHLNTIIRVTSDCPLIDPTLILHGLDLFNKDQSRFSYASNCIKRTYPRGFDFEIFSREYLELADRLANEQSDREHVTPFIWKNKTGSTNFINILSDENFSQYRLTVDTEDDLRLIKKLIENYSADKLKSHDIINLLTEHPEIAKMNQHIEQKKV